MSAPIESNRHLNNSQAEPDVTIYVQFKLRFKAVTWKRIMLHVDCISSYSVKTQTIYSNYRAVELTQLVKELIAIKKINAVKKINAHT